MYLLEFKSVLATAMMIASIRRRSLLGQRLESTQSGSFYSNSNVRDAIVTELLLLNDTSK